MKPQKIFIISIAMLVLVVLAACAPAATPAPAATEALVEVAEAPAQLAAVEKVVTAMPMPTQAPAAASEGQAGYIPAPAESGRLIVKNAEIVLEVTNTDIALDRVTQVVDDAGGYIISSQIWYEQHGDTNYKFATLTVAVPVDYFELAMRRLRDLAEKVINENASGQDVTDEYVDLESRLTNLRATRDRIRTFLEQATKVEEALKVNEQLSEVEGEIEQVQGRMNYLKGRAAYSTITVTIQPVIPELTPTPTPTPTATPTPTPWNPGQTVKDASSSLGTVTRALVDLLIWVVVLILPFALPVILIVWLILRARRRKPTPPPPSNQG